MVVSAQHFREVTNGYEKTTSGLWTHKGKADIGTARITNNLPPLSGAGMELAYSPSPSVGYVSVYDRTTAAWGDLILTGKNVQVSLQGGTLNLPAGSVTSAAIADGTIATADIATNAVTQHVLLQAAPAGSVTATTPTLMPAPYGNLPFTARGGFWELSGIFHLYNNVLGGLTYVGYGLDGAGLQLWLNAQHSPGVNYYQSFPVFAGIGSPAVGARSIQFYWSVSAGSTANVSTSFYSWIRLREYMR